MIFSASGWNRSKRESRRVGGSIVCPSPGVLPWAQSGYWGVGRGPCVDQPSAGHRCGCSLPPASPSSPGGSRDTGTRRPGTWGGGGSVTMEVLPLVLQLLLLLLLLLPYDYYSHNCHCYEYYSFLLAFILI